MAIVVGVLTGLLVAVCARWVLTRLPAHPAGTALVLVCPFAAYTAADAVHGSGVLAVVTLALSLSRYSDAESAQTRLVSLTTWEVVELLVTGAAFAFVGLELRAIMQSTPGSLTTLIVQALAVTAVVIVLRFAWIFPVATLDERLHRRRGAVAEPIGWREMTVSSWAGMRGVVTLVTALALPAAFPERDRLVFIAFVVVIITLLLQGLTLPVLVKVLRVSGDDAALDDLEQSLIRRAQDAGMRRLDELRAAGDVADDVVDHVEENAARMWHAIGLRDGDREPHGAPASDRIGEIDVVRDSMLAAAREVVLAARSESGTDPGVVDDVLRRLDARGTMP
ncbi:NhaP-type Na+/H+ or K+/H+ antiporter [Mycolicibacterium iranicum]|uniref:NhaP-type Na+/H+ or K+/H+ antiporter n=1 Tax=Mycolicibacterium iranicum TaxID=912594 RepID=A0A839QBR8_MYCIR|nr:cation:proton antiporter [Mycolicibacterium iranicum]MBB2993023.1 NhaP-type Na+/H+ or K+/H+ antiporter [Mycolicibacterium iranicum]